jgi:hypothetical protein
MKVVINSDYGGFGLSHEAKLRYIEEKGLKLYMHYNKEWDMMSFYTVPYEEYQKVYEKDLANGLYKDSNSLHWNPREIERNDPILVRVVQEMGEKANGRNAKLKIVDIPLDIQWTIEDYDGSEWVAEKHRTWS